MPGGGSNGKSVFLTTLQKTLGKDYALQAAADLLLTKRGSQHPTAMADLFGIPVDPGDQLDGAMREAQDAIRRVLAGSPPVDLHPQPSFVRKQQHQAARSANLISHSYGRDPYRHVRIYRE